LQIRINKIENRSRRPRAYDGCLFLTTTAILAAGGHAMRMMLTTSIPHEPCNSLIRDGKFGPIIKKILEEIKPEAAYFTEQDGNRGAVWIVNVSDPSRIPALAEPFFLNFNADCRFRICMTADDLGKAGLDEIAKRWR
jgi:hypothetical protein